MPSLSGGTLPIFWYSQHDAGVSSMSNGHCVPAKRSWGTHGLLRLPSTALAKHPHQQSHQVRLRHHPASHQALKGLPEPRRHAAHDVQARTMRWAKLEKTTRLWLPRQSHHRRRVQRRNWNHPKRPGRRMTKNSQTPDLTITLSDLRTYISRKEGNPISFTASNKHYGSKRVPVKKQHSHLRYFHLNPYR